MDEFDFKFGVSDDRLRAIHRKLAIIKDRLPPECQQFLCGKSSATFNEDLRNTLRAFQSRYKDLNHEGILDAATWRRLDEEAGSVFTEVWQYELDALRSGAIPQGVRPADEEEVIQAAHQAGLTGLAFSGGGIRSATFNLGILQALAERGLLRKFDYLSTVSGGGYIGAWFSKWLKRENGNIEGLERKLTPGTRKTPIRQEPEEVRFLRQYSNYLSPKTGLFSTDTWSLLATYFRNTVLNLSIVMALLGAALIVPRLLVVLAGFGQAHAGLFAAAAGVTGLWAVFYIALSISTIPQPGKQGLLRGQSQAHILWLVILPLLVSAFSGSIAVWQFRDKFSAIWHGFPPTAFHPVLTWVLLPGLAYFAAWSLGWLVAQSNNRELDTATDSNASNESRLDPQLYPRREPPPPPPPRLWDTMRNTGLAGLRIARLGGAHLLCALTGLGVGALLLSGTASLLSEFEPAVAAPAGVAQQIQLVSFGMALMLSIFGIAMILTIGLVGRMYADSSREWWSRQGGWTAALTLFIFGISAMSLYGEPIVRYLAANLGAWGKALVASAWFGTVLAGLILGRSSATGPRGGRSYLDWLAVLAPPIFSVGALLIVSTLVFWVLLPRNYSPSWGTATDWSAVLASYYADAEQVAPRRTLLAACLLAAAGLLLSARVDVNKFSLYMMYRNRLVRAYLGASNHERRPHPFTGFDQHDDIQLDELLETEGKLQRPYHIVNTALNLVSGKELAWQTRKAAAFSFTPAFCGFELPSMAPGGRGQMTHEAARGCYRPTRGYRNSRLQKVVHNEETGIDLGMAVAVSGAAVSPNMGYHSSPSLAFLMTLFNVRLGRWFANPLRKHWKKTSPSLGIRYLLSELLGMSDSDTNYVHLSDGGHFENLGIYELVRRRCNLIVVVDAGADGDLWFEDLGNAIRKCATDLHIEIDIDVSNLERLQPSEFSRAYCVVGNILYERTDLGAPNGTLLYIKPVLIGNERADLKNYKKANKDFPHQTTVDQWFDETQFESYRSLGYRVGSIVFDKLPPDGEESSQGTEDVPVKGPDHAAAALAEAIQKKWRTLEPAAAG